MIPDPDEARTQRRFAALQLARFAGLGAVMAGIAIAYDAVDAPYWLGVVLALGGFGGFFYGPRLLARRFKAEDRALEQLEQDGE